MKYKIKNKKYCATAMVLFSIAFLGKAQITRQQIIENALPYTNFVWQASTENIIRGVKCGKRIIFTPLWVKVGLNVSMPYGWGGATKIETFKKLLSEGKCAGDICSTRGGGCRKQGSSGAGISCIAGVDCSGLVSIAWNLPGKLGTTDLVNITTRYSSSKMVKPGDIFIIPGNHVVLMYMFNNNGSLDIIEASMDGNNTAIHTKKLFQLEAYQPRYYKKVID